MAISSHSLPFALIFLALSHVEAFQAQDAVCKTCRKPQHSWNTMPVFLHSSVELAEPDGSFSPADLEVALRFSAVTIEKWQASANVPFLWEEDAMIATAKQIKSINSSIAVFVWFDSVRIYTSDKKLNPDITPNCATGHFRPSQFLETHPDYLLMNSSGLPALEPWSHCHIYDFTKDYVRNYWRDMCLNMTASGYIDGCGADASWQTDPARGTLDPATLAAWTVGHEEAMRETSVALGDGVLLGKHAYEVGDYVSGALEESCKAANSTITLLQNLTSYARATNQTLVYECHCGCNPKSCTSEVAAFLIGAGDNQYFGLGGWNAPGGKTSPSDFAGHWIEGVFDRPLGAPLSDGTYDATTGLWQRTFASGTYVTFDTTTNIGNVTWGSSL